MYTFLTDAIAICAPRVQSAAVSPERDSCLHEVKLSGEDTLDPYYTQDFSTIAYYRTI